MIKREPCLFLNKETRGEFPLILSVAHLSVSRWSHSASVGVLSSQGLSKEYGVRQRVGPGRDVEDSTWMEGLWEAPG